MIPSTLLRRQQPITKDSDPTCVAYNELLTQERTAHGADPVTTPGYPDGALVELVATTKTSTAEFVSADRIINPDLKVDVRTTLFPAKLPATNFATKDDPAWIREWATIAEGLDGDKYYEASGSALPAKDEGHNINNWRI